jgi:hypothetical protein
MSAWKDVLGTIVSTLGKDTGDCVLEFLRILPEEVREGRKINLTVCGAEPPSACGQPTAATLLPRLRI